MSRRLSIVVGVAVLAVIGYAIKLVAFPSPEASVQRFFDALQARNLGAAAEELTDDLSLMNEPGWTSLWMALNDGRFQPPQGVRMGGWQSAPTTEGERLVAVQYELGGATHSSLIRLHRLGSVWRISNGTGLLTVNIPNALINGQALGSGKQLRLLPGIYELTTNPAAPLLTAPPVAVVVTPGKVESVRMPTTLTKNALEIVKARLDTTVKLCETTVGVERNECPFKSVDTTGLRQVQWRLITMPEVTIEQTGTEVVTLKGSGSGSVRLLAVGPGGESIDRVDSFSLNGKCVDEDASISCTFTG